MHVSRDAVGRGLSVILVEQEDLASITPRTTTERFFNPPSQIHWILILLSSIFVIPGLVLVAGISTWLARRRQG